MQVRPSVCTAHVTAVANPLTNDTRVQSVVRVSSLQPRWTVGLFQDAGFPGAGNHYDQWKDWQGHCKDWTVGCHLYTVLGLDAFNATAAPLYVGRAAKTHIRIGHPVVATGSRVEEVFIQVTHIRKRDGKTVFHVALNNPTAQMLTIKLHASFPEVQLQPEARTVTLRPGEHLVVQ